MLKSAVCRSFISLSALSESELSFRLAKDMLGLFTSNLFAGFFIGKSGRFLVAEACRNLLNCKKVLTTNVYKIESG